MRKFVTTVVLVLGIAGLLSAILVRQARAQDTGIAVGAKAPDLSGALDHSGKARSLTSLMGEKGLALVFFRSASW